MSTVDVCSSLENRRNSLLNDYEFICTCNRCEKIPNNSLESVESGCYDMFYDQFILPNFEEDLFHVNKLMEVKNYIYFLL